MNNSEINITQNNTTSKIRIGIAGYGNLGRGVEFALNQNDDMELVGIFTRRDKTQLHSPFDTSKFFYIEDALKMKSLIDVMIICGGSATDLPVQSPFFAEHFNIVDSFDNHGKIPKHFNKVNLIALQHENTAVISAGWDPGLFSINRALAEAALPLGKTYTFWGKGVSQGHSDAIRRIPGVVDAIQYTIPIEDALKTVREGKTPDLSVKEKHKRECFVVVKNEKLQKEVKDYIITMPDYFEDYITTVNFITLDELNKNHKKMDHGGLVIRSGKTGINEETDQLFEFSLKLGSNPQFTSSVLVAYARAAYRLSQNGNFGAKTVLDIPPALMLNIPIDEQRAKLI